MLLLPSLNASPPIITNVLEGNSDAVLNGRHLHTEKERGQFKNLSEKFGTVANKSAICHVDSILCHASKIDVRENSPEKHRGDVDLELHSEESEVRKSAL